jgi:hypothetical protein
VVNGEPFVQIAHGFAQMTPMEEQATHPCNKQLTVSSWERHRMVIEVNGTPQVMQERAHPFVTFREEPFPNTSQGEHQNCR